MSKDSKDQMSYSFVISCIMLFVSLSFAQISWNSHVLNNNTNGTASVHVCDVDNDGDLDVVGAVLEDNQMVWWRNEGGNPIAWTKFIIAYGFLQAFSVYAADLDGDSDQDVIGAAGAGDEVAWWSNDGGNPIQWSKHTIRTGYDFAHEVYAHDLDEDGDIDVFGAST
ncbi:MAG: VCBS repeat-containing protein, partial [candidate division WOR-3 bacterium]